MESVLGRYRNLIVLVAVLFAQVLGLAVQVKRTNDSEPTRLILVWAVGAVTPLEKMLHWAQSSTGNIWHNYIYLRGVRAENRDLKQQIQQMRLEQARMTQDADQARRLQALFAFKEQFISKTVAAQVIGSTGSEQSRAIYIDKGAREGLKPDMAVITKDGIVGKVLQVYGSNALEPSVSQVLLINDQTSGVGAILDQSRLQGILRGTPTGEVVLEKVMTDESVPVGEPVLTSGGDGIFPKGLPVGTVTRVSPGSDLFLNIHVRPAANLNRLEEVLVVTKIDERQAAPEQTGPVRAVDILAERLPTVPAKEDTANAAGKTPGTAAGTAPGANVATPAGAKPTETKPNPATTTPGAGTQAPSAAATKKTPTPAVSSSPDSLSTNSRAGTVSATGAASPGPSTSGASSAGARSKPAAKPLSTSPATKPLSTNPTAKPVNSSPTLKPQPADQGPPQ